MLHQIRFVASAKRQLRGFAAHERTRVLAAIENQLLHEPLVETRNRKRLRSNPLAPWELRVGNARVYYDVEQPATVTLLAVGTKVGNRVYIEGKEVEL